MAKDKAAGRKAVTSSWSTLAAYLSRGMQSQWNNADSIVYQLRNLKNY